jgi:hypothetical protein
MKRPFTIAAVVSLLLLLPLAGGAGLVWWQRGEAAKKWPSLADEPPLALQAPLLPEDELAWKLLLEAIERYDADRDSAQEQLSGIGMPPNSSVWAHQQVSLARIKQAMTRPGLRTPYREDFEDAVPDILPLMQIGRNQVLRGWESAEAGLLLEAVDDMLLADTFGSRLSDGSEDLIIVMTGIALMQIALEELEELIALVGLEEREFFARALDGLQVNRPLSTSATARGVTRDCMMFEATYRELGERPELLLSEMSTDAQVTPSPIQSRIIAFRYDADATIAQHRRVCRAAVRRMASMPYEQEGTYAPPIQPSGFYNDVGSIMLNIAAPDFTRFADQERTTSVHRSGLVVLLAARLHTTDHGTPPATLEALVPEYLPSVPLDPFTGKPMSLTGTRLVTGAVDVQGVPLSWELMR